MNRFLFFGLAVAGISWLIFWLSGQLPLPLLLISLFAGLAISAIIGWVNFQRAWESTDSRSYRTWNEQPQPSRSRETDEGKINVPSKHQGVEEETAHRIFLSYAREDEKQVKQLYKDLISADFSPWMDTEDLLPGESWRAGIENAIKHSAIFLACLSLHSVGKRGFIQKEIKYALDVQDEMLESDIYLIPVRLEDCVVPERLRDHQWVDLFDEDGLSRLLIAIYEGLDRRTLKGGGRLD